MTLNGIMTVTLRYFNEFGKPAFQLRTTCSSIEHFDQKLAYRKFTFAISSPDEFLVTYQIKC